MRRMFFWLLRWVARDITAALPIEEVWPMFTSWCEAKLGGVVGRSCSKHGVLTAWNGKGCDMGEFFKVTNITHLDKLHMPQFCPFFWDPMKAVSS